MTEYRPTEYVVDFGDCRSNRFVCLNMMLIKQNGATLNEQIVRCRDCKHYRPHEFVLITDIEHVCLFWANGVKVRPDGFCAWGIKKEVRDD